jgi:citrate synthase
MELCYLLLYGELPSKDELKTFERTVINNIKVVNEMMVH